MKIRLVCLLMVFALLLVVLIVAPAASAGSEEPVANTPDAVTASSPAVAFTGVKTVATGGSHTCVISQSDGTVSCWGANGSGQLGDGTVTSRDLPVKPSGLGAGALDVTAGGAHSCAVTAAGGVKCWGDASEGQIGDGLKNNRLFPVDVSGLAAGVKAVAAGSFHTCALLNDGTVKCWGKNDKYQLGDGTTNSRLTPTPVPNLAGVTAITAGAKHTCALLGSGAMKCWGANGAGQIGNGFTSDFAPAKTPTDVTGLQSGVVDITAGDQHTCAALNTGELRCWGKNDRGQLGIGGTVGRDLPAKVEGIAVKRVTAGSSATCAVLTNDMVACWGDNSFGQLGSGTITSSEIPLAVPNLFGVSDIAAGSSFACAVSGGALKCWGDNSFGQLADGNLIFRAARSDVAGLGAVTAISAGYGHTCAIKTNGEVVCWGANMTGQLGNDSKLGTGAPVVIPGLTGATRIAAGGFHSCAIVNFNVRCWGNNERGQVGANVADKVKLTPVSLQIFDATGIAAGYGHTCAVASGGVKCWGQGEEGQIGNGSNQNQFAPVAVTGLAAGSGVNTVVAGAEHSCALLDSGGVKCWGKNDKGQLGNNSNTDSNTPVDVAGISTAKALTAGGGHTCALLADGSVQCWGTNDKGQLGDSSTTNRSAPVTVAGLPAIASIAAGGPHTCAVTATGNQLYCWGNGTFGELGNWGFGKESAPVLVRGASAGVTGLALGISHTCAELNDQAVACWGWDGFGQLGQGTVSPRLSPVAAQASMPATLTVTPPNNGKPGSTFLLTGHRFAAGTAVQFTLNGVSAGSYNTDSGSFVVVLETTGNAPGTYLVRASQTGGGNVVTNVRLVATADTRQVLGGSVTIAAQSAAPLAKANYLPLMLR